MSHALSALESELGVTLLEPNHTGVVALTNVGEKIIPHVRALLAFGIPRRNVVCANGSRVGTRAGSSASSRSVN